MELNVTKLSVLIQYNNQYRYNFCTVGIAGYLKGHISREIFMSITSVAGNTPNSELSFTFVHNIL